MNSFETRGNELKIDQNKDSGDFLENTNGMLGWGQTTKIRKNLM